MNNFLNQLTTRLNTAQQNKSVNLKMVIGILTTITHTHTHREECQGKKQSRASKSCRIVDKFRDLKLQKTIKRMEKKKTKGKEKIMKVAKEKKRHYRHNLKDKNHKSS